MKHGRSIVQVLGLYAAASWVVLQIVDVLKQNMDLPDWVFPLALILLLIGLPIILTTLLVQKKLTAPAGAAGEADSPVTESVADAEAAGKLFNWRNAILGGVLAFSLLFGFAGLAVLLKERVLFPEEALAENAAPAIAILPFTVRGEGLEVWSEGMVDVLATALDGVAGMRTISGRTAKAQWDQATSGGALADKETALEVATGIGARYAVHGNAIASGAGMRISADLYDVYTGELVGHSQVEGPVDSIFPLVDSISLDVLRMVGSGDGDVMPGVDLAGATTTSVEALKAYLEGEADFRRGAFEPAIEHYLRAVEADSTFALAYARLARAYAWSSGGSRVDEMYRSLEKYASRLPARERLLATQVYELELDVLEELRALIKAHPDDAEAWYILGELYFHEGEDIPVSVEEAERAFERAGELDPGFALYHIHLVDLGLWFGRDSASMAAMLRDRPQDGENARNSELLMALVFGGDSAREAAFAALDTVPYDFFNRLQYPLKHPRYGSVYERYLEIGYRNADRFRRPGTTAEDLRRGYLSGLAWTPLENAGQFRKGLALMGDSLIAHNRSCYVYSAFALGYAVPRDLMDEAVTEGSDCFDIYMADLGDNGPLEGGVAEILAEADSLFEAGDFARAAEWRLEADFAAGYGLWRAGEPEAALALMEPGFGLWGGYTPLLLAQLYMELGRPEDAVRYLNSLGPDESFGIADYWLGQAYEQAGEPEKAASAYGTFLEGWSDPEPEAQHIVEDAQARLEAIVRERG